MNSDDGRVYTTSPVCGQGGLATCHEQSSCFEDGVEGLLYTVLQDGNPIGATCLTDAQAESLGVVTPGMVLREMRRLTWPASPVIVQPPGGRTLVNFETNFYTDNTAPTTQTVTLLGQPITIEATPSQYLWSFGDGETTTSDSPGTAYPDLEITHSYLRKGKVAASIDTVYAGRYRIGGGGWQAIPDTHTVPGDPVGLTVVEASPQLVG